MNSSSSPQMKDSIQRPPSFSKPFNFSNPDSVATLEYLGSEPLTHAQTYLYPNMPIYPDEAYSFGLENCDYNIPDPHRRVSKKHFRIYTIVYEKNNPDFQPLVYCEDLQSLNGTYVNGVLIGKMYRDKIGHLLTDGDTIEVKPSWKFRFHQPTYSPVPKEIGVDEDMKRFSSDFSITSRILGQGQYGTVYLAKELACSAQVACKILDLRKGAVKRTSEHRKEAEGVPYKRVPTSEIKQEALREIRILERLSHPNILNLRKAFYTDSMMYIFTDLAPGGDLFSYIAANNGRLEDLSSRIVVWQLLKAVDYMHSLGILHRDIKSENVLIAQTEAGGRVILTDFGFAAYESKSGRRHTQVGTSGFMPPEIENRPKWAPQGYTKAVDLWSCGILVAFMLTGDHIKVDAASSLDDQQEEIDKFCNNMTRLKYIKPNSVDLIQNLVVARAENRLPAPYALEHKWFTESKYEAMELQNLYRRVTQYWSKRSSEDVIVEDMSPPAENVFTAEGPRLRRRKKLPDVTSSPYFGLDRHLQGKGHSSKRKEILAELKADGSSFVSNKDSQSSFRAAFSTLQPKSYAVRNVEGTNIFGAWATPSTSESQIETQDLTPYDIDDVDDVDMVPHTRSSTETTSTNNFSGHRRSLRTGTFGSLFSDKGTSTATVPEKD